MSGGRAPGAAPDAAGEGEDASVEASADRRDGAGGVSAKKGEGASVERGEGEDASIEGGNEAGGAPQDGKDQNRQEQDGKNQNRQEQDGKNQNRQEQDGKDQDGKNQNRKDQDGPTLFGRRVAWRHLERGASFGGWASLLVFIWAAFNQLNQWQAAPFVLLFYGALVGALASSYAARRAASPDSEATASRRVLWALVGVLMLWFWVPPSRYGFFWLYRRVAVYFLS